MPTPKSLRPLFVLPLFALVCGMAIFMGVMLARGQCTHELAPPKTEIYMPPSPSCPPVKVSCECPPYEQGWDDAEYAHGEIDVEREHTVEELELLCSEFLEYGYVPDC